MEVHCPDCRQPLELGLQAAYSDIKCAACGTALNLVGDETLVHRPRQPHAVGRFRVLERLGGGAFGTVWKARDDQLDRVVAVKVPRDGRMTPQEIERFLQEARIAARLSHPNIVGIHEVGRDDSTVYIVADYIDGTTLADALTQGRPSADEAAALCAKIADALHYAHGLGVVHRDLKPSNILLDRGQEPHVADFGLARQTGDEVTITMDGRILGTPAYMAPEQARGDQRRIDARSDVYALGVILFELLTGERPFRGSAQMLIHQVIENEPPGPRELNRSVPRDLETICLKCLEKEPRRRYPTAKALADDLRRYLAGEAIAARPISRLARAWRWATRNRLAAVLAAALVLALAGGLVATTSQWLRARQVAARETQTRVQIELLSKQLLELAGRLKALERTETRAPDRSQTATLSLGAPAPPADLAAAARAPARPSSVRAGVAATRPLREPRPRERDVAFELKTEPKQSDDIVAGKLKREAKEKLRELEQLSPEVAKQYRDALPSMFGD